MRMQILQSLQYLQHKILDFAFTEPSLLFDHIIERLAWEIVYFVGTKLKNNIDVEVVLKIVQKLDDVFIVKIFMDFDLAHQLCGRRVTFSLDLCLTRLDF